MLSQREHSSDAEHVIRVLVRDPQHLQVPNRHVSLVITEVSFHRSRATFTRVE